MDQTGIWEKRVTDELLCMRCGSVVTVRETATVLEVRRNRKNPSDVHQINNCYFSAVGLRKFLLSLRDTFGSRR